jgi:hypothetical protein
MTSRQRNPIRDVAAFMEGATPGGVPEYRRSQVRNMREGPMQSLVIALTKLKDAIAALPANEQQSNNLRALLASAWRAYEDWNVINEIVFREDGTAQRIAEQSMKPQPDDNWAMAIDWERIGKMSSAEREEELVFHGELLIEHFARAFMYWINRLNIA